MKEILLKNKIKFQRDLDSIEQRQEDKTFDAL
jgi:hypothetical protein